MIIEGRFSVPARREQVWNSLWDIGTTASWVPGCTNVDISVFERLGALGFPIIKRKAQEAEVEFARRAAQSLSREV
jgi:carbon monoxide dehydrogenase subunit G